MGLRRRYVFPRTWSELSFVEAHATVPPPPTSTDDMSFKKPLRDEAEAAFAARKDKPDFVDYEFKDYKGTRCPCHFSFLLLCAKR